MWIPDGTGTLSGNYTIGGDYQITDGYSVRYHLADKSGNVKPRADSEGELLHSMMEVSVYAEARFGSDGELEPDSEGNPVIWLAVCVERMVCTDLDDPGSTERWCDYEHTNLDIFFNTEEAAEVAARERAEKYAQDPELFRRDFSWDGLAPWERQPVNAL